MKRLLCILLIVGSPALAQETNWHLFTQSEGGTVSLLHGLTKDTCEFAMNRALGRPATEQERQAEKQRIDSIHKSGNEFCSLPKADRSKRITSYSFSCSEDGIMNSYGTRARTTSSGDIRKAECFQ